MCKKNYICICAKNYIYAKKTIHPQKKPIHVQKKLYMCKQNYTCAKVPGGGSCIGVRRYCPDRVWHWLSAPLDLLLHMAVFWEFFLRFFLLLLRQGLTLAIVRFATSAYCKLLLIAICNLLIWIALFIFVLCFIKPHYIALCITMHCAIYCIINYITLCYSSNSIALCYFA